MFLLNSLGLVNVPEEPIEEEEEEEEDQDMDADDRVVVEYHEELPPLKPRERSASRRSSASSSDSDEMDYDLELKMISTPSPKKSMKMTMYADEVESQLKSIRYKSYSFFPFNLILGHAHWYSELTSGYTQQLLVEVLSTPDEVPGFEPGSVAGKTRTLPAVLMS